MAEAAADFSTSTLSMSAGLMSARRLTWLSWPPPMPPPAREIEFVAFGMLALETMTPSIT